MHPLRHFLQRVHFQRHTHAPLAPQQIRHRRNLRPFRPLKQQRRPRVSPLRRAEAGDPLSNLRNLQDGIHLRRNLLQLALLLQRPDKFPQIPISHFPSSVLLALVLVRRREPLNSSMVARVRRTPGSVKNASGTLAVQVPPRATFSQPFSLSSRKAALQYRQRPPGVFDFQSVPPPRPVPHGSPPYSPPGLPLAFLIFRAYRLTVQFLTV